MENYSKGKNVEEPLQRDEIPILNLPATFIWMQVRPGSKIRNLLNHALDEFEKTKHVVWTGYGPSVGKAITCAEIMKRECRNLHQITRIGYRTVEEYWDPKVPLLDQIVVKRKLPMIHIYLSTVVLNTLDLGYQAPDIICKIEPPTPNIKNKPGTSQSSSNGQSTMKQRPRQNVNKQKKSKAQTANG